MSIGNWYRVGTVAVVNGSANVVGTGTFWTSQCNPGDRFTVDQENWYEVATIVSDTAMTIQGVGGSGAFAGTTASNLAYAIDRNFTNNLNANIAASVASLVAQYQANSNGALSGLFGNGLAATPGIAFLNEASTGFFHPATGIAALSVQGAEFLRAVGTAAGVPAMLGIGQVAPANALDVLTTSNALYGARIQNASAGTAARAALQIGNGAQVLNAGVNGASYAGSGVLTAARGFLEAPTGLDMASGVASGNAYSWGIGSAYTSKMTLDYQGNLALATGSITTTAGSIVAGTTVTAGTGVTATTGNITAMAGNLLVTAGKLGIGMTPSNVLDIAQSQNAVSVISLLNGNAGSSAATQYTLSNGTSVLDIAMFGTGYTTGGVLRQAGGAVFTNGFGGLTLATTVAAPIYFGINNAQVAQFDTSGNFMIGAAAAGGRFTVGATNDASNNLVVNSSGSGVATLYANANGAAAIAMSANFSGSTNASGVPTAALGLGTANNYPIVFTQNAAERMRIDTSGNLLAGTTTAYVGGAHTFQKNVTNDAGNPVLAINGNAGQAVGQFYAVSGSGASASGSAIIFNKHVTTGRSGGFAGTLNASGADYAEYRQLIPALYGAVAKGVLLGYDANGLMTNLFANVVGRVLPKSTSPSYVGKRHLGHHCGDRRGIWCGGSWPSSVRRDPTHAAQGRSPADRSDGDGRSRVECLDRPGQRVRDL